MRTHWSHSSPKSLPLALVLGLAVVLCGCTVTRSTSTAPNGAKSSVVSYTVAYPWLDSSKSLSKAIVSSATNKTSVNLSGFTESETANTNTLATLEKVVTGVVGAAVGAAVSAAK